MPEKVEPAQTLIPNVNACTGQPLTFAESKPHCTFENIQYACFSVLLFLFHPLPSSLFSSSARVLPRRHTQPPEGSGVEL